MELLATEVGDMLEPCAIFAHDTYGKCARIIERITMFIPHLNGGRMEMLYEEVMALERRKLLEIEYDNTLPLIPSTEVHRVGVALAVTGVIDLRNVADERNLFTLVVAVVDDESAIVDGLLNELAEFVVLTITGADRASTHLNGWLVFVHFFCCLSVLVIVERWPARNRTGAVGI